MFDGGEGIVEVVEEGFPLLVLGRLAEVDGVALEGFPLDEEEIAVGGFDAVEELVRDVAVDGGDEGLRLGEGGLELLGLVGFYVEYG